mmetsp:Transcript_18623/g.54604  ORF Transcript_18623/g.54604 Transcript_18623/m.54604 type:complete len:1074 (-) Transcript_18623:321-3542(-)
MGCGSSKAAQPTIQKQAGEEQAEEGEEFTSPLTEDEIQERVVAIPQTKSFEMKSCPLTVRYAYVSQRGYYPDDLNKNNQDAYTIAERVCGEDETIFFGVFDGHGATGDKCSNFVKDSVVSTLERKIREHEDDFERAYKETFVEINERLHADPIDDTMSGTTAITCFMSGQEICIANIGDSRAIIGEKKQTKNGERVIAYSLSIDQTPYRGDERERVKKSGAEVMSCDQKDGIVPFHENWGINLGEDVDTGGDPPRVWERGQDYPGCAFTRSIGDAIAEDIGVFAEPELMSKELTVNDKFVLIASDGIFEFITNQGAADIVSQYEDPLEGARAIVAEAYRLWLQYEVRTDDITIIVLFLDWREDQVSALPLPAGEGPGDGRRKSAILAESRRLSQRGSADLISMGIGVPGDGNRPVRRGLSREKRSMIMAGQSAAEEDFSQEEMIKPTPKTEEEIKRISAAVKTNFLFAHLNDAQRHELYAVMKRVEVKAGDVIIRQGDPGDWFYVVDEGVFVVTQKQGKAGDEKEVHIFTYKNEGGVHHCFGELALMYSKPRAATVTADTDGVLWAMARSSFRRVLMKSSAHTLTKVLRSVDILKSLSTAQMQRLQDILAEVTFKDGEDIITQGSEGKSFFIIVEGSVVCTRKEDLSDPAEKSQELMRLQQYQYFGERALLHDAPRAATVTAVGPCKCLSVERAAFEEVLGPLQSIIDDDAKDRERAATVKQLEKESAGLTGASLADFGLLAIVKQAEAGDLSIVVRGGQAEGDGPHYYSMRSISKQKVVETKQEALVMREQQVMLHLPVSAPGVAVELMSMPDDNGVHAVLKSVIVTNLEALMADIMEEHVARFYVANILQAIAGIHESSIVYRNVNPEYIMVDNAGYVQLIDFRLSKRVEGKTFTTCGAPEYLAPEIVKGEGHGASADFWALGVLMYEMLVGESPFKGKGEMDMYMNITSHKFKNELPNTEGMSKHALTVIEEMLHHDPNKRLGARMGLEDFEKCLFFGDLEWVSLQSRHLKSPFHHQVSQLFDNVRKRTPQPVAQALKYEDFKGDQGIWNEFNLARTLSKPSQGRTSKIL